MAKLHREIKNRWTGAVIHSGETNSIAELVTDAVTKKISLSGSDLRGSNLGGSDLGDSNLSGSNLSGSNLRGSNLRGSNLRDSNLSGSDLGGSNLRDSDLRGSDLRGSNLGDSGAIPSIPDIHKAVYEAASKENALDMGHWHSCETTHCRAGWVITLAGDAGAAMEYCLGTSAAAALIYMQSDPKLERVPNFYASNEEALADMKRLAELEQTNA